MPDAASPPMTVDEFFDAREGRFETILLEAGARRRDPPGLDPTVEDLFGEA